jgi:hypothetical protein
MKRNSERGVALVITLIMLALVTFMAVVFLAISRREKSSVTVIGDITQSRLMADAGYSRAVSEVVARMMTSTNPFAYDLLVSTNYINIAGFHPGVASPLNVNFDYTAGGQPLSQSDWLRNIANLQYDPRPPVVVPASLTHLRTNDFRFYLDLNRNGVFDPTGYLLTGGGPRASIGTTFYAGDPQWIGVLEHPDLPHSETNQFVGRYAYVIVPTGKTLDVNFMYNNARRLDVTGSGGGFYRDQGVGSWEINLAGFFTGLNTNTWAPLNLAYSYNNNSVVTPNQGYAFTDANVILAHRYANSFTTLPSAAKLFNFAASPNNPFATNGIDYYAVGSTAPLAQDVTKPWPGGYNTNGYYDVQELFDPNKTSAAFVNRLTNRAYSANPYDRYTFYRLLSQLSTDSQSPVSNKLYFADYQRHYTNRLNLNYTNNLAPNSQTNFVSWDTNIFTRNAFFTNAADRLLRASLDLIVLTNGLRRQSNFMMGLTPVRDVFSCTNIQIYNVLAGTTAIVPFFATNNEYTATTHRMLQLAANIHDATTRQPLGTVNDYPSVFRPIFMRTATNLIICGFTNQLGIENLNNWQSAEQAMGVERSPVNGLGAMVIGRPYPDRLIYGVPLVIGVKKGYPSFNKFVLQTVADISRKLELIKLNPSSPPVQTNQMYVIGVTNHFGIEGWNSYASVFNHNVEIHATNLVTFALHHRAENSKVEWLPITRTWSMSSSNVTAAFWQGSTNPVSFMVPVDTNINTMPQEIYFASNGRVAPLTSNVFERSFRVPQWTLFLTNRLQYIVIDHSPKGPARVIDFVNLDKVVTEVDLSRALTGDTNAAGGGIFSDQNKPGAPASLGDGDMWNPRHITASIDTPSLGVLNQIGVSKGLPFVGQGTWSDVNGQIKDKQTSIQHFLDFLNGRATNLTEQAPFTPSRRIYQRSSWEANDPLVHYTLEDLTDLTTVGSTNLQARAVDFLYPISQDAMLRQVNPRYRPWGGNPSKDPSNDPTAYALTLKDPLIRRSDDWQFPTNKFPNIGWLGRVHRGTPWQTVYLKAGFDPHSKQPLDLLSWATWSGSFGTHPTNDWRLLDLFTVAPDDRASRGLLSVNQTNLAAWSAVLSGVVVSTNALPDSSIISKAAQITTSPLTVQPLSPQLMTIVDGINRAHLQQSNQVFRSIGDILSVPELTVQSPYLSLTRRQMEQGIDDNTYERIPQQILSLLKTDEPRVTIYAFGQALKPAERSLVTAAGYFNLCTNYQITGEYATKTVVRLEEMPPQPTSLQLGAPVAQKVRAVVESYQVLQSN